MEHLFFNLTFHPDLPQASLRSLHRRAPLSPGRPPAAGRGAMASCGRRGHGSCASASTGTRWTSAADLQGMDADWW